MSGKIMYVKPLNREYKPFFSYSIHSEVVEPAEYENIRVLTEYGSLDLTQYYSADDIIRVMREGNLLIVFYGYYSTLFREYLLSVDYFKIIEG